MSHSLIKWLVRSYREVMLIDFAPLITLLYMKVQRELGVPG
jgi:hypothetical protein